MENRGTVYVIGHKNPDTDSICSAIGCAALKNIICDNDYIPARCGAVSSETQFALDYFGVEAPKLIENISTQVSDIEIRHTKGVSRKLSIKNAWNMMQDNHVVTIPVVNRDKRLEGLITVSDVATSYMNVYDSRILSDAKTSYRNIVETINGEMVVGSLDGEFDQGKVIIATANPDKMEDYIEEHDLVILGDRYESQLCAIEMGASCLIVCIGAKVSMTISKIAAARGCRIITTPYDAYTVSRLINQSIPVEFFMKRNNLTMFDTNDYLEDISDVMKTKRYRDFPILGDDGRYVGMISRRNLMGARGKKVILVDHNERSQSVDGISSAEVVEIIDHHRVGTVETMAPVFFRNQPLGCTATIVWQMYKENGVEVEPKIAGLLCSAILSDTLVFRSPTCTAIDKAAAEDLAKTASINIKEYAEKMFSAGENFSTKTDAEILYQDFKRFTAGDLEFGVSQVISTNRAELDKLGARILPYMKEELAAKGVDMMFLMLTDFLNETTRLVCAGDRAKQTAQEAFADIAEAGAAGGDADISWLELPGVLSRKKQLVPKLIMVLKEK